MELVLPPRRLYLSRHERRKNAELEYARDWCSWTGSFLLMHALKDHSAEMRWLAELFPVKVGGVRGMVPRTMAAERLSKWCAEHGEDARALAHLANVLEDDAMFERAASMGDTWAMGMCAYCLDPPHDVELRLALASAEKGDANGTYALARLVREGRGCEQDEHAAEELLIRAAELGNRDAMREILSSQVRYLFAIFFILRFHFSKKVDPSTKAKLFIGFFGLHEFDFVGLASELRAVFRCYARDGSCGDAIFEIGEMMKGNMNVVEGKVFGWQRDPREVELFAQAVEMHDQFCNLARAACVAWILVAKRTGLNKDVRRFISKMVWDARSEPKRRLPDKKYGCDIFCSRIVLTTSYLLSSSVTSDKVAGFRLAAAASSTPEPFPVAGVAVGTAVGVLVLGGIIALTVFLVRRNRIKSSQDPSYVAM